MFHSNVYAYWVPSYIEADPKLAIPDLQHRSSKQCCGSGSGRWHTVVNKSFKTRFIIDNKDNDIKLLHKT